MSEVEVTPDGWTVLSRYWDLFRFVTSHEPPRPNALGAQLQVDARDWKAVYFWVIGAALIAAAVATGWWPFAAGGVAVLAAYLVMLLSVARRLRDCPAGAGVIDGLTRLPRDRHHWAATAFAAGGRAAWVAVPAALAPAVTAGGGRAEVLFLPAGRPGVHLVLAVRPLAAGTGPAPNRQLPSAPALTADAPDVPWGGDARRILAGVEAEAGADGYLGTCHLLLAAARYCPVAGLHYAAARAATPAGAGGPVPAGGRWPTPSLRRAVARAAERAQGDGRPVEPRDVWYSLLTDPDAECHLVLDALGLNPDDLLKALVPEAGPEPAGASGSSIRHPPRP